MDKGYKIRNPNGIYFLTFAVVEWVDVFTRKEYADMVIESLKYCQQEKGLILYGYCLMHNHLHLIASSADEANLSDILRDFKKFTSKQIIKAIEENTKESRKNCIAFAQPLRRSKGCYGFLKMQALIIVRIRTINSGGRITSQKN